MHQLYSLIVHKARTLLTTYLYTDSFDAGIRQRTVLCKASKACAASSIKVMGKDMYETAQCRHRSDLQASQAHWSRKVDLHVRFNSKEVYPQSPIDCVVLQPSSYQACGEHVSSRYHIDPQTSST